VPAGRFLNSIAWIRFSPAPLSATSLLLRSGDEGQAFRFVSLRDEQTERLAGLARQPRGKDTGGGFGRGGEAPLRVF